MLDKDCYVYEHDYSGGYITKFWPVSSTSQCKAYCDSWVGCDIFEFSTLESNCYLKSWSTLSQRNNDISNIISGPSTCTTYEGKFKPFVGFKRHFLTFTCFHQITNILPPTKKKFTMFFCIQKNQFTGNGIVDKKYLTLKIFPDLKRKLFNIN